MSSFLLPIGREILISTCGHKRYSHCQWPQLHYDSLMKQIVRSAYIENHDLVIISQLPDNQFNFSNVAPPIHLSNTSHSFEKLSPFRISLRQYMYVNFHHVVLVIMLALNAQAVL